MNVHLNSLAASLLAGLAMTASTLEAAPAVSTSSVAAGVALSAGAATTPRYERWHNHYADSLVTKCFMRYRTASAPDITLDQARELIRNAWEISGGLHQIVYLVGTSFGGLDSKYPCWTNVNESCVSELSPDPRTALRLAMREAREKYNCDLSLHINTSDAHPDSPDWARCEREHLLRYDKNGKKVPCLFWYQLSHAKDWKSGFTRERIDALLEMLPELKDARTIHIDAFYARPSEKDGITLDDDKEAIRLITDYWHQKGLDVTTEFITSEDMIGLHPMVWHNNMDEWQRLKYPISLVCGGDNEWNWREKVDYYHRYEPSPMGGCRYEECWGIGHWGDWHRCDLDRGRMVRKLFSTSLLFVWYNRHPVEAVQMTPGEYRLIRKDGVVSSVRESDRRLTVTQNGRTVVDGTDYFLDMPYGGGTLLVHSAKGCDRTFELPPEWKGTPRFEGLSQPSRKPVTLVPENGKVRVKLAAGEALTLHRR